MHETRHAETRRASEDDAVADEPSITPTRNSFQARSAARDVTLDEPVVIARWWKNRGGEEIRVRLSTYKNYNLIDCRTWFTADDGTMRPGKGFACTVKHLPKLVEVFTSALRKANELGMIEREPTR
jgi:Transcriptional Coactivator p15 (PC4)